MVKYIINIMRVKSIIFGFFLLLMSCTFTSTLPTDVYYRPYEYRYVPYYNSYYNYHWYYDHWGYYPVYIKPVYQGQPNRGNYYGPRQSSPTNRVRDKSPNEQRR